MKFPIIKQEKNKLKLRYFVTASLILLPIIGSIFFNSEYSNIISIFLGIFFLVWNFMMFYLYNVYKTFKIISFLEYKNDTLLFKDISIKKEDIKGIIINYNSYFGGGITPPQGDNNKVVVVTKDRRQYRFTIYLSSINRLTYLERFVRELADSGIKITFYARNKKVFPKSEK